MDERGDTLERLRTGTYDLLGSGGDHRQRGPTGREQVCARRRGWGLGGAPRRLVTRAGLRVLAAGARTDNAAREVASSVEPG